MRSRLRAPHAPPGRLLWGSDPLGPAELGLAGTLPADRDTPLGIQPGASPAHCPSASPRRVWARGTDDPGRTSLALVGDPQLTGTRLAAGHYSIAGSATAPQTPAPRPPRPSDRGSRRGTQGAVGSGRRGGGRGLGCPNAECLPAAAAARGGTGGEHGAGRGGDHVPGGGGPGDARCSDDPAPLRGRRFQEIQTLRQEIGILTKHSRPAAAPRRGLPPRLTLGQPAEGAGRAGSPTPGGGHRGFR